MPLMLASVSHDANSVINCTPPYFGQDDQNEMQHDFLDHVLSLALASCDGNGIINGPIAVVQ